MIFYSDLVFLIETITGYRLSQFSRTFPWRHSAASLWCHNPIDLLEPHQRHVKEIIRILTFQCYQLIFWMLSSAAIDILLIIFSTVRYAISISLNHSSYVVGTMSLNALTFYLISFQYFEVLFLLHSALFFIIIILYFVDILNLALLIFPHFAESLTINLSNCRLFYFIF